MSKLDKALLLLRKAKIFAHQQFSGTLGRTELLDEINDFELELIKEEVNGKAV